MRAAWILLFAVACAKVPAVERLSHEGVHAFAIAHGDDRMVGTALVTVDARAYELRMTAPTGLTVFVARGHDGTTSVEAPDPGMAAALERIPFRRDLDLVLRLDCAAERCRTETGTLVRLEDGSLRWRGAGGAATVRREGGRVVVEDGRRHYALTVAVEDQ